MRVKVVKEYNDLELKKVMKPGREDSEFSVTKERGEFLIRKGFVEEVKPKPKKEVEPADKE